MATRIARIQLKSSETKQLIQIAGEANDIASAAEFRSWTQSSVRKLLPHEALIAGVARREGEKVSVERLLSAVM